MKYCTRSSRRRALNAEDNVAPLTPSSARSSEGQDAHCASLPVQKAAITKTKLSRNSSKGTKAVGAVAAEKAEVQGAVAQVGAETKRLLAQLDRMEKRLEVTTNALAELERDASKLEDVLLCPICWDNHRNLAFTSCGHSTCSDCGSTLKHCPMCRKKITKKITLWW